MIQVKFLEVPAVGKPVRFEHNGRTATSSSVAKCVFGPGSTCQVTTSSGSVYSGPYSQPTQMQPTLYAAQAVFHSRAGYPPKDTEEGLSTGAMIGLCLMACLLPIIGLIVGAVMLSSSSGGIRSNGRTVMTCTLVSLACTILACVVFFGGWLILLGAAVGSS